MSTVARSGPLIGAARKAVEPEHTITPQELEVLALYASGYIYEEIGRIKFLSPYTVRNRIQRAAARSGARNVTHLIAVVAQKRMIKLNPTTQIFEPDSDPRMAGE